MKQWIRIAGVLGVFTLSGGLGARIEGQAPTNAIALVGGALIDGTGAPPVRDSVVLIRGDRIERVGTLAALPVPAGYESISTEGMTVLPGLWDLHVHLIYSGHPNPGAWFTHDAEFEPVTIPASARQMLMGGVTSVRDLAAPAAAVLGVKHIGVDSPEYAPDIAEALRARVTRGPPLYWTPTVGANGLLNAAYFSSKPEIIDDPENYLGLPAPLVAEVKAGWAAYQPRAPRADAEAIVKRKVAQMREAGVELVFGTDEGSAGQFARHSTWMDADLWVRVLGLDPMWVLRRMTLDAAAVMGADRDNGSVAAGKYADVIAVGGDPLRHIDVLRDPKVIVRHGRRFK